ncbi:NfeD family protein [Clostridium paraputrificum]|uniref:NfeD family protein n=1 Tax=Clostridium TaxID=1485 RepID=UPI003D34A12C
MGTLILWLVVAAGAILLDLFTSAFLFVWFAIGAFAAVIAGLLGLNFGWQLTIFGVVSIVSIAIGYPWAKKKFKKTTERVPLMEETYIGREFVAEEDIVDTFTFKVSGVYWTGENRGSKIKRGQKFQVTGIDGNKLLVTGLGEE